MYEEPKIFEQGHSTIERSWIKQLYRDYDNICYHYRLKLKPILIDLNHSKYQLGSWDNNLRKITISSQLIQHFDWSFVQEIFKHEVAHQIVSELYCADEAHGPKFQQACDSIAVEAWARKATVDLEGGISHWKDTEPSNHQSSLRRKATKLLALATSKNEHEALTAMNMVRALYRKHHLDEISNQAEEDYVTLTINHKKKRIETHQTKICTILSSHFFVQIVFSSLFDAKKLATHKTIEIMGRRENVLMAEYVYWFLNNNLQALWKSFKITSNAKGIAARNSYYMGVLIGFDEKLSLGSSRKDDVQSRQEENKLIYLANQQVDQYVTQRHPRLQTRSWGASTKDSESFYAGKNAGTHLNLNKGIHRKNQGSRIFLT